MAYRFLGTTEVQEIQEMAKNAILNLIKIWCDWSRATKSMLSIINLFIRIHKNVYYYINCINCHKEWYAIIIHIFAQSSIVRINSFAKKEKSPM